MELFKLFGTIAVNNSDANQAIDDTTGKAEKSESKMSAAFKKIGSAVTTYFAVDKIIDFGKEIANAAAEVDAEASAFAQIMGEYSDEAAKKVEKIADATGIVSTRLNPYMTSMSAKFKGLGYDVEDATDYASRGLYLAADAAAFWDVSLDDSMSHLNSFINGSYEGGEAIGLFANDTQLAMYAVKSGLIAATKDWANLDEATKQATRLEYAENMFKQSGATGQAAREADQYANVQANLNEKWRQFKAEIGEPLLQNIVIPAVEKLSGLVDKLSPAFQTLKTWVSENQTALKTLAGIAAFATGVFVAFKGAMAIQGVVQGFQKAQVALSLLSIQAGSANLAQEALNGTLTIGETIVGLLTGKIKLATLAQGLMAKGQAALNAVMSANPIALVVTAVVALIAVFVILWKKCDWFRNFWIGLWDGIKKIAKAVADWFVQAWASIGNFFTKTVPRWFNSFKEFFANLWNGIKEFFSGVWNGIKNVLTVVLMFIVELIKGYFNLITLPFRFIWENCKDTIVSVWNTIVGFLTGVWNTIKDAITTAFNAVKSVVVTIFTAIKNFITTVWNGIADFFTPILEAIKEKITTVFNVIKEKITTIFNAVKEKVTSIWNEIKEKIITPIDDAKDKVVLKVTELKDKFVSKITDLKNKVQTKFNEIKEKITEPINKAQDTVKEGLDKIKGFFDKLKLKFPNIKLPHFSIQGKFSLDPPSVPKLNIDWYAKAMHNAMLLNSPTIFGVNPAGQFMGGGEAGQEVVSGASTLMNMIQTAVRNENSATAYYLERLLAIIAEYFPEIIAMLDRDIVLDDGTLVGKLAPKLDKKLGDINKLRERRT